MAFWWGSLAALKSIYPSQDSKNATSSISEGMAISTTRSSITFGTLTEDDLRITQQKKAACFLKEGMVEIHVWMENEHNT